MPHRKTPSRLCASRTAIAFICAATLIQGAAVGQCEQWTSVGSLPGVAPDPEVTIVWDPDGEGPLTEVLVVAGHLEVAGASVVSNVATWNGSEWQALGNGLPSYSESTSVYALAVYNGELI